MNILILSPGYPAQMQQSVSVVGGRPPENRLHGEIGHIPPLEHEANWRHAHTPATMAITTPS